jgi:hypothetical protein
VFHALFLIHGDVIKSPLPLKSSSVFFKRKKYAAMNVVSGEGVEGPVLLLPTQQAGHEFGSNPTCVWIFFLNAVNWRK